MIRPASSASFASVRRFARRETLRNLSSRTRTDDARSPSASDDDRLLERFRRGWAKIGPRGDHFAGFEAHRARAIADARDLAAGFDVIAGMHRCEKLDAFIAGEEPFVAIVTD